MAIWHFKSELDAEGPQIYDAAIVDENTITVSFDKWVRLAGASFEIDGKAEPGAELLADFQTVRLGVQNTDLRRAGAVTLTVKGVANYDGAVTGEQQTALRFYDMRVIGAVTSVEELQFPWPEVEGDRFDGRLFKVTRLNRFAAAGSKVGRGGFNISFVVRVDRLGERRFFMQSGVTVRHNADGRIEFLPG